MKRMNKRTEMITELSDGIRSSQEIADLVGCSSKAVRKTAKLYGLPRLKPGARVGAQNHEFVSGRRIDRDGYVLLTAPDDHPFARLRTNRKTKLILEHRLVMESELKRYLLPTEVVDHIDELTLHNAPSNLRIFAKNGDHLHETISGFPRRWSKAGHRNIGARTDLGTECQPVDTYQARLKSGDVRLLQILLAALKLGIDSPFLLGSHRHLEKAQIDYSVYSNLELALAQTYERWEAALAQ